MHGSEPFIYPLGFRLRQDIPVHAGYKTASLLAALSHELHSTTQPSLLSLSFLPSPYLTTSSFRFHILFICSQSPRIEFPQLMGMSDKVAPGEFTVQ